MIETTGRLIGYVRMSTDKQVDSPEVQRHTIKTYVSMHNLGPDVIFFQDSAKSGTIPLEKRPSGKALLLEVKKGDRVIIAKIDRMFRNTLDCLKVAEELRAKGVHLHVCDMFGASMDLSSPIGKMILTMIAGFAEFERSQISARTKEALAHKKRERQAVSRWAGLGCMWDKRKVDGKTVKVAIPDPEERAVMKYILRWRTQANPFSWAEIAENLRVQGVKTREGKLWDTNRIRRGYKAELLILAKLRENAQKSPD